MRDLGVNRGITKAGVTQGPAKRLSCRKGLLFPIYLQAAALLFASAGHAVSLSNGNSTATLDLNSSAGLSSWTVDGINQLNQQWLWFRIGSGPQLDISQISSTPVITTLGNNQLTALYTNGQYGVSVSYTLLGGSAGHSALAESINFFNYQPSSSLDLHLFMYSDFTLGGPDYAGLQNVALGQYSSVQTVAGQSFSNRVAFTSQVTPIGEAGADILNQLASMPNLTLSGAANAGPGHVTWAFEWDKVIGPGQSLGQISITDTLLVPEPSAAALAVLGLGALVARKRFKFRA